MIFDDEVAIRANAVDGADIWIDPALIGQVFFSDRLRQALTAPTIKQPFKIYSCKIIDAP